MENASKALLIAGAILIAIVLVTIGILVLGNTGETTDAAKDTASSIEIQTINAQFKQYEGKIDATQATALKALADSKSVATDPTTFTATNTKKYKAEFSYDTDGAINKVTITER